MWLEIWIITIVPLLCYSLYRILDLVYRKSLLEDFANKRVFITGTDTGFGRLLALKLDKRGLVVYAGCYTQTGAEELKAEASSRLRTIPLDVSDRNSIQQAKDVIEKDLGPGEGLWGVVNNAGIVQGSVFYLTDIDDYRRAMEVNFFGAVNVCEIFGPLVQQARGRIVNVCSVLGRVTGIADSYACSKHALEAYTDGLRIWMNPYGVHVVTIEPGGFQTQIISGQNVNSDLQRSWDKATPQLRNKLGGEDYFKAAQADISLVNMQTKLLTSFNRVPWVPKAIIHALGSTHPKHRYVVGVDGRLFVLFGTFVPDWLMVQLVRLNMFRQFRMIRSRANETLKPKFN